MSKTYTVNGRKVETYDKSAFSEYRSKWTRDEDATNVDVENNVVPQYGKYFPEAGGYPDEVYEETGCMPADEFLENVSIGDTVLYWNGPPCNENAYLTTAIVRELPPVEYHRPRKPSVMSDNHFVGGSGNTKQLARASGGLFGEMTHQGRIDCVVAINPDADS